MIAYLNGLNQPGIYNDVSDAIDKNLDKLRDGIPDLPHSQFFVNKVIDEDLEDVLIENKGTEIGFIEDYVNCVYPQNEFNLWAFKKWIVGCVHNWISPLNETKVSPLTFVLCGQKQGTGKTSFFRNLLPKELQDYLIEKKIDGLPTFQSVIEINDKLKQYITNTEFINWQE